MEKLNFSYDKEQDDLFLFKEGSKSKGGIELWEFVFDFDSKSKLVGIQVTNASEVLNEINQEISKVVLCSIEDANIETRYHNNLLFVKLILHAQGKEIYAPLQVPNIRETSPALIY